MTVPKSIGTRILDAAYKAKPVMMAREIRSSMKAKAGGWACNNHKIHYVQ